MSLDGAGGLRASQRWHTRGQPIVYCAPNPATALLEILVHLEIDLEDLPDHFRFLKIEVPDAISVERVDGSKLPTDWQDNLSSSRQIGDTWLQSTKTALLAVPCIIVPETSNWLLNPTHPEAGQIRIIETIEYPLDSRLL